MRPFPQDPPLLRRRFQFLNHRTGLSHDTHQFIAVEERISSSTKSIPASTWPIRSEERSRLFHLPSEITP